MLLYLFVYTCTVNKKTGNQANDFFEEYEHPLFQFTLGALIM